MKTPSPRKACPKPGKTSAQPIPADADRMTQFLRDLIAQAGDNPQPTSKAGKETHHHSPVGPHKDVLMSYDVDGTRFLVVRDDPHRVRLEDLSQREQEIVRMVAKGFPNKAIADVLEISVWTVGTHLRRIFSKLGVTTRAAMVAKLVKPSDTI